MRPTGVRRLRNRRPRTSGVSPSPRARPRGSRRGQRRQRSAQGTRRGRVRFAPGVERQGGHEPPHRRRQASRSPDRLGQCFMPPHRAPARDRRAMKGYRQERGALRSAPSVRGSESGRRDLNPRPQCPERSQAGHGRTSADRSSRSADARGTATNGGGHAWMPHPSAMNGPVRRWPFDARIISTRSATAEPFDCGGT